jgi:hypothetical protein
VAALQQWRTLSSQGLLLAHVPLASVRYPGPSDENQVRLSKRPAAAALPIAHLSNMPPLALQLVAAALNAAGLGSQL